VLVLASEQNEASEVWPRAEEFPTSKSHDLDMERYRYLSHASRRSGMKPFGSTIRPELIFYRDMSGKRANEAHGGFGVSNGPSSSAQGLE
ncbi:unnamed protein product, partial [Microthlaspi erraticum]